jgi:phage terminase small subunit
MTIEEIKAELEKHIKNADLLKSEDENHLYYCGQFDAYSEALRLLKEWNGK